MIKAGFWVLMFYLLLGCKDKQFTAITEHNLNLNQKDSVEINRFLIKAFNQYPYSKERENYIDSALAVNNKVARLWQQKAMPYYKARKYQVGKPFLAEAVRLDEKKYLDYSAFMKCIFSKEYSESLEEFELMKKKYGDSYVMDHTYNFYMGLCYLQLNDYENAKTFLIKSKDQQLRDFPYEPPEKACHYLDWFYMGITEYELGNYRGAIMHFDTSLSVYTDFAEALFYKGLCLINLGQVNEGNNLIDLAKENKGSTINEDNAIYELYPYQIFHQLQK